MLPSRICWHDSGLQFEKQRFLDADASLHSVPVNLKLIPDFDLQKAADQIYPEHKWGYFFFVWYALALYESTIISDWKLMHTKNNIQSQGVGKH